LFGLFSCIPPRTRLALIERRWVIGKLPTNRAVYNETNKTFLNLLKSTARHFHFQFCECSTMIGEARTFRGTLAANAFPNRTPVTIGGRVCRRVEHVRWRYRNAKLSTTIIRYTERQNCTRVSSYCYLHYVDDRRWTSFIRFSPPNVREKLFNFYTIVYDGGGKDALTEMTPGRPFRLRIDFDVCVHAAGGGRRRRNEIKFADGRRVISQGGGGTAEKSAREVRRRYGNRVGVCPKTPIKKLPGHRPIGMRVARLSGTPGPAVIPSTEG